jgi:hypothetical protein
MSELGVSEEKLVLWIELSYLVLRVILLHKRFV